MRESRQSGSVEGVMGNHHSYSDSLPHLGEVAGGDEEVRGKLVLVFQILHVVSKPREERVEGGVGLRKPEAAEPMVAAELEIGDVQKGDGARRVHGRPVLRSGITRNPGRARACASV